MAQAISISVEVRGMRRLQTILGRLTTKMRTRRDLHARWSILALNWINKNFQSEGGMVGGWKKLRPNTLASRRGGSGRILQDTGILRASFIPRWTSEEATVGSSLPISLFHEKGTDPYTIVPKKPGGMLRFKVATQTGVKTKTLASGKKISLPFAEGGYISTAMVHHPGLPARRMLPRSDEPTLMVDLLKAAISYLKEAEDVPQEKES